MVLRKHKNTQVPVWIRLRHLPVEFWTDDGLSTVASGVGRPLYQDTITRACTRLDFARVCVMLDISSTLPKHLIIMMPKEDGKEVPCKVEVEYEWVPPKCKTCMSLGHMTAACPDSKKADKPQVAVYVQKRNLQPPVKQPLVPESTDRTVQQTVDGTVGEVEQEPRVATTEINDKGKEGSYKQPLELCYVMNAGIWNVRGLNRRDHQVAVKELVSEFRLQFLGLLETRVSAVNVSRVQSFLPRWSWFTDYDGPGNRIWIAWDDELLDVNVLDLDVQFIHCRITIRCAHLSVLATVVYGANDTISRRGLWQKDCILDTGLIHLPVQGERFSWHNCSEGDRSLWKRLDRLIVNDAWLGQWPNSHYHCLNARTSDHSPLVIRGDTATHCQYVSLRQLSHDVVGLHAISSECLETSNRRDLYVCSYTKNASSEAATAWGPWARHVVTSDESIALVKLVTREEIKDAFFDIAEDKAPGPDGYSSGFYKAAWPVIGEEVVKAILEFFTTGRLLKQVNTTILALIPKEMFSGYNRQGLPMRCALKVDLRKAYDTVEWDFLSAVLHLFGFPDIFIGWIEECVTPMFSVCIKEPSRVLQGLQGLRQGDPMSPFLFVLVMEVLQLMLQQLIDQNEGFSFHWRCKELGLFQLCFADDLLLFCKADVASVRIFRHGLDEFAKLSGLHANPQKSQLILSRSAQAMREHLIAALQFQEGHLPLRYLGLPLLASRLSISDCQPLLLKIDSRIKGWDSIQLSFAGRL
ncbi:UNVERIFIED_CONTAM: hypothetical protein Scaly_2906900 [Sesamum calycinum]|uniref:Reverse transcriptase domain-containing protein n=1 Tax=Sesamum calycinum TaxID=2727403 RepID=A0AAW2L381_9LAMI